MKISTLFIVWKTRYRDVNFLHYVCVCIKGSTNPKEVCCTILINMSLENKLLKMESVCKFLNNKAFCSNNFVLSLSLSLSLCSLSHLFLLSLKADFSLLLVF